MTENLAGRGEGLKAGDKVWVMVEFLGQRNQEAKIAIKSLGSVTNWDGEAQISIPVAALEAAAPLSTGPSLFPLTKEQIERITARVQPQIEHEFIHGYTGATAQVLRVLTSLKIELDALATPSPQAPGESYPGQDYVHAHNKNIRNADNAAAVRRAFQLIADANTVTILSLSEMQAVVLNELRLVGSPRKVGEDGAKVGDEVTWTGQEGKRCRERIRRITEPQPGNYVFWVGKDEFPVNHQQVELVPRSSSVPVGEQKQEEGV